MSDSIVIEESNGEIIVIEPTVVINQTTCDSAWGEIGGDITEQADLVEEFAKKMNVEPTAILDFEDIDMMVDNGIFYSIGDGIFLEVQRSGNTVHQIMYEDNNTAERYSFTSGMVWSEWNIFAYSNTVNDALSEKVDKVIGKGLSTNDYTTAEKTKLAGVEAGAQANAVNTVIDANYVHTDNNYTSTEKTKLSSAVTSSTIATIVTLTQTAYDALNPKLTTTLYIITGA